MAVLLCSADTAAGQASFILKSGPSAYGPARVVPTGRGPLAAVQCSDGSLYLAMSVSDEVLVLSPDGTECGWMRVGWAPRCLASVPGTPFLLVANAGSDTVSVVETTEAREVARVAVGREPGAIAVTPDGNGAVVCERGAGSVAVLDLSALVSDRKVRVGSRIALGAAHAQPRAVALCGDVAVVACTRLDVLPVVNVAGGRVVGSVRLPGIGAAPAGIAVTGEGGYALVSLERVGALAMVDLLDWAVTRVVPVGAGPRGVTIDPADATVYCALAGQRSLAVVHLDGVDLSNTDGSPQFEVIPVGAGPSSVALVHVDDAPRCPRPASPHGRP
ncbi:YncE family protein [Streptomyces sp. NPDC002057]|uniref:YncE family protein n=1 Tax=Streptomyces sp. NPDC002057 TaxID=3154664 RepID=UPI00333250F1